MIEIKLTKGQVATISDCDAYLTQYKWRAWWNKGTKSYYAIRNEHINGKQFTVYMHRQVLGLKYGDKQEVDHINHDTLNNQQSNVRIVTHSQNMWNQENVKGYYWNEKEQKYAASIAINGKRKSLGYFHSKKEARSAYLQAKKKYHQI
ncbi:MAG: HNH endonuclease [bacterium]|jgi:hypothetical protein|nr:HNH endonuclease [bacterium]